MPRQPRMMIPGVPLHVVQRGVHRGAIFVDDADRHTYMRLLCEACGEQRVAMHAFVLMSNHVHMLLTPGPEPVSLAKAMRVSGQCYVQYFNARHLRTGTLWQGRYKSCLVDTSPRHVLAVMRYIELNPVRAALVADPAAYRWSSAGHHLGLTTDERLTTHPAYLGLGSDRSERGLTYRRWLELGTSADDLDAIRRYAAKERAFGGQRFQAMVAATLGRDSVARNRGRPPIVKGN